MAAWGGCAEESAYFLLLSVLFGGFCRAHVRGPDSRGGESGEKQILQVAEKDKEDEKETRVGVSELLHM